MKSHGCHSLVAYFLDPSRPSSFALVLETLCFKNPQQIDSYLQYTHLCINPRPGGPDLIFLPNDNVHSLLSKCHIFVVIRKTLTYLYDLYTRSSEREMSQPV